MPELPEVEVVVRGLNEVLPGKIISKIIILSEKSLVDPDNLRSKIIGQKINSLDRKGKYIIISVGEVFMVIHLKMTGQLVYRSSMINFGAGHPNDSLINKLPDNSTRVIFELASCQKLSSPSEHFVEQKSQLFFNDQRKFGWVKLVKNLNEIEGLNKLGTDVNDPILSNNKFIQNFRKHNNAMIKPKLLDQSIVAGIGNIYADESLFISKINPTTKIKDISDQKLIDLHKNLVDVINLSISLGGSTDKNYVDSKGQKGSYLKFAKVFRKDNQPCPVCAKKIKKTKVGGRGTHYCSNCQGDP